jgi:hypothetical protein
VNATIVGVRATRGAPIQFVMSSDFELRIGDVVLVESPLVRHLAVVALSADQILALPGRPSRSLVVAGPTSLEVEEALRARNAVALERARLAIGPTVRITGASWSADGGRLTLDVVAVDSDWASLAETLEPVFRAEVRCVEIPADAIPE